VVGPAKYRDVERAQQALDRIADNLDDSWATLVTASFLEYRLGNYSRCVELAERSAERKGNQGTHSIQFVLSMAKFQRGNTLQAHQHYELALEKTNDFSTNPNTETDLLRAEARALLGITE